ncbi:MAG: cytochrome b/b6 domain-containing protein [Janthinobacterium lividum]
MSPAAPTHDYRAPLRLWHWLNALLITGQLVTILFQEVIVNARSAVPEFVAGLQREHVALSAQQAGEFAHLIGERIWQWHIGIGLVLAAAWLLRVVLELRGPSELRFSARLLAVARRYRLAPPADQAEAGQELLVKGSYALFYLMLSIMVITGLLLTWADDVAALHRIEHPIKEVHGAVMYGIIGFVLVHVVGVVRAEITTRHGLISRMVGGR